jgi:hypothetical protein
VIQVRTFQNQEIILNFVAVMRSRWVTSRVVSSLRMRIKLQRINH